MPDLAFRSAGDPAHPAVLLVHGYPASSHMWDASLQALADRGLYALAPDLAGFGDSEPDPPGTWERHVEALERFRAVHEVGPRGAGGPRLGRPDRPALGVRAPGRGVGGRRLRHRLLPRRALARDGRRAADARPGRGAGRRDDRARASRRCSASISTGHHARRDAAEYFKAFADEPRRRGQLELYRSGDFEKLAAYEGRLAALDVPFLALWGEHDAFAPVAGAAALRGRDPRRRGSRSSPAPGTSCSRTRRRRRRPRWPTSSPRSRRAELSGPRAGSSA